MLIENAEVAKSTGGMIALLPADPAALAVTTPGGEPAEELHVTIQFLGRDVTGWDATRKQHILDAARIAVSELDGPIDAQVVGHATFAPGGDDQCAVYLVGDSDDLDPLHAAVTEACADILGDDHHDQHAPHLPHLTAGYGLAAADLTYTGPVLLDRLVVVLAGERTEIPIPDQFGTLAREAYAHGWALSGGPMTARVRAGCTVAVQLAREHRHDPRVLEATIDLGSLEGTQALIFQRREDLIAKHIAIITKAWRALVSHLDIADQVRAYRHSLGLTEGFGPTQNDPEATAHAYARALLQGVVDPVALDYKALVDAVASALLEADAEGKAAAIAQAADQMGYVGFDFDLAFSDATAALGSLDTYWGQAGGWLAKVVNGNAADLGNALARVHAAGGSFEDMFAAASEVLDGADVKAVDTIIDMAMSQSFSNGALNLYQTEGVLEADYVTAGGDRVCPICLGYEGNNPWPLSSCPAPGVHPYCRCVVMPSNPLQALRSVALSRYTTTTK